MESDLTASSYRAGQRFRGVEGRPGQSVQMEVLESEHGLDGAKIDETHGQREKFLLRRRSNNDPFPGFQVTRVRRSSAHSRNVKHAR